MSEPVPNDAAKQRLAELLERVPHLVYWFDRPVSGITGSWAERDLALAKAERREQRGKD